MKKILLVDDSFIARYGIKSLLAVHTFEVIEATNGNEALEKIENQSPDLVLLDLLMPHPDGLDVLETLQHKESKPPVIVLSADIQETTQQKCLQLGASAFLKKPPQRETLIHTIMENL